jgi:hypothetical protein
MFSCSRCRSKLPTKPSTSANRSGCSISNEKGFVPGSLRAQFSLRLQRKSGWPDSAARTLHGGGTHGTASVGLSAAGTSRPMRRACKC